MGEVGQHRRGRAVGRTATQGGLDNFVGSRCCSVDHSGVMRVKCIAIAFSIMVRRERREE